MDRRFLESDDAARSIADLRAKIVEPGTTVEPEAPISQVIEALLARPSSRVAHVVDSEGKLLGTVSWRSVLRAAGARMGVRDDRMFSLVRLFRELGREKAKDVMRPPTTVQAAETLREALLKMERHHENDLPIVDTDGLFQGEVNGARVMTLALETFRETEAATERARGA